MYTGHTCTRANGSPVLTASESCPGLLLYRSSFASPGAHTHGSDAGFRMSASFGWYRLLHAVSRVDVYPGSSVPGRDGSNFRGHALASDDSCPFSASRARPKFRIEPDSSSDWLPLLCGTIELSSFHVSMSAIPPIGTLVPRSALYTFR